MPDREPRPAAIRFQAPIQDAVRGMGLAALGYVLITLADAAVKWVLPETGVAFAMIWRGLVGALTVALLAGRGPGGQAGLSLPALRALLRPATPRLVLGRSVLHCAVTVAYYFAWMRGMALADVYAVSAATPLVMTVLAIPLLGEQVGWRRWTSTALGFAGVLVMLTPGGGLWRWESAMLLAGVGVLALTRIWMRRLGATDRPATVAAWLMLAHIPVGLALLPAFPPASLVPSAGTAALLVVLGVTTGGAHLLFARAFAAAPVSVLAPLDYSTLIWGLPLGLAIWGDWPAATTLLGAAVIVAAGLYNLHRERVRAREDSATTPLSRP